MRSRRVSRGAGAVLLGIALAARAGAVPARPLGERTFRILNGTEGIEGGASEKYLLEDDAGTRWLFKPMDTPTAFTEEAMSRIGARFGLETPEVHAVALRRGLVGSLARIVETTGDLRGRPPASLTLEQLGDLLEIQVFRWLFADFDSHERNFLVSPEGRVLSIDHGRAFEGGDLYLHAQLPGNAFSRISYYGPLWAAYRSGRLRLPLDRLFAFVARVQEVPSEELDAILRPLARVYLEARGHVLRGQDGGVLYRDEESFLFAIHRRRRALERSFRDLVAGRIEPSRLRRWSRAASPRAPSSGEVPRPVLLRLEGGVTEVGPLARLGRRARMVAAAVRRKGLGGVFRDAGTALRYRVRWAERVLERITRQGIGPEDIADLDLHHLPGGPRFLKRLERTPPADLELLRERVEFLHARADDELARTNGARLLGWITYLRRRGGA